MVCLCSNATVEYAPSKSWRIPPNVFHYANIVLYPSWMLSAGYDNIKLYKMSMYRKSYHSYERYTIKNGRKTEIMHKKFAYSFFAERKCICWRSCKNFGRMCKDGAMSVWHNKDRVPERIWRFWYEKPCRNSQFGGAISNRWRNCECC